MGTASGVFTQSSLTHCALSAISPSIRNNYSLFLMSSLVESSHTSSAYYMEPYQARIRARAAMGHRSTVREGYFNDNDISAYEEEEDNCFGVDPDKLSSFELRDPVLHAAKTTQHAAEISKEQPIDLHRSTSRKAVGAIPPSQPAGMLLTMYSQSITTDIRPLKGHAPPRLARMSAVTRPANPNPASPSPSSPSPANPRPSAPRPSVPSLAGPRPSVTSQRAHVQQP
jgi:hypothetical protein